MAKKPALCVALELNEMYGRMATKAAYRAVQNAADGYYANAQASATQAEEWAKRAGGNVIRRKCLGVPS